MFVVDKKSRTGMALPLAIFVPSRITLRKTTTDKIMIAYAHFDRPNTLGFIYTDAKAKATFLPISYIVSNLCIYNAATAAVAKTKEKIAFALI